MVLISIGVAWAYTLLLIVAMCRVAAIADAQITSGR